jgi:uncharacterized spore protein YtfJ
MDQFNLTENVDNLFQSFENFTQREGVIGKPVTQCDKTFLPVVSVTIGYGGGNANMGMGQSSTSTSGTSGSGALGLGAKLYTEAIIIIDNQQVSLMPMNMSNGSQLIDKIPQIISGMGQNKQASQAQTPKSPTQI